MKGKILLQSQIQKIMFKVFPENPIRSNNHTDELIRRNDLKCSDGSLNYLNGPKHFWSLYLTRIYRTMRICVWSNRNRCPILNSSIELKNFAAISISVLWGYYKFHHKIYRLRFFFSPLYAIKFLLRENRDTIFN